MRKIRAIICIFLFASSGWLLSDAKANSLKEYPLEKNVHDSDIVILGTVREINLPYISDGMTSKYAKVKVLDILKGQASETVGVLYKTGISERDPDCCVVGETYLFLLTRINGEVFISVNGKFAVRNTTAKSAVQDRE